MKDQVILLPTTYYIQMFFFRRQKKFFIFNVISIIFGTGRFSRSLITNLIFFFRLVYRVGCYRDDLRHFLRYRDENPYPEVFGVADHECEVCFQIGPSGGT